MSGAFPFAARLVRDTTSTADPVDEPVVVLGFDDGLVLVCRADRTLDTANPTEIRDVLDNSDWPLYWREGS